MKPKTPSNKFSIYLIKEEYANKPGMIFKKISLPKEEISGIGTFYYEASNRLTTPSWVKSLFESALSEKVKNSLKNASSKAVLLISVEVASSQKREFAISFGHGRTLLEPGVWEERFGFITALNILDPASIKRIDKKSISSMPKDTIEQLSKVGNVANFGIDIEQELVSSITGKGRKGELEGYFETSLTGKAPLSLSAKVDLSNIKDFLKQVYTKYQSVRYKEHFDWVDQIKEISDKRQIETLNEDMLVAIREAGADNNKIWMAVPQIIEWDDVSGFCYGKSKKSKKDKNSDILLKDFLASLPFGQERTRDVFDRKIHCFSESNDSPKHVWRAFDCLYCEIEKKRKTFLLINGKWYGVKDSFVKRVNDDYQKLVNTSSLTHLPEFVQQKHQNEQKYNEFVGNNEFDFCCMDRKNIPYGGGHSSIEFCDLYSSSKKKIIHVKRYGGSSVFSHLFNQGVISGEAFTQESFRKKVNAKLPPGHKLSDTKTRPEFGEFEVVFGIISSEQGALEIPFFSKASLRNAKRKLEAFGYKVSLQKIKANLPKKDLFSDS